MSANANKMSEVTLKMTAKEFLALKECLETLDSAMCEDIATVRDVNLVRKMIKRNKLNPRIQYDNTTVRIDDFHWR